MAKSLFEKIVMENIAAKQRIVTFRDLVQDHPELMDIEYRETPISEVVQRYRLYPTENMDYEYNDFKAYYNLELIAA